MKLCVITCTYGRPHLLPRVIKCFEEQDHKDRCMLIYDDGCQYQNQSGDGGRWQLVSENHRASSLGAKRNSSIAIACDYFPDIDAVLPCDDDDFFLPWHLSSAAKALENAEWSRPSVILTPREMGNGLVFMPNYTGHRDDTTRERLYHPAWAMRVDAVYASGGYPEHLSGPEDQGLMRKMEAAGVTQADPISMGCAPSYVYCWGNENISGLLNANDREGKAAWAKLEKNLAPTTLQPWEPPFDLHNPVIAPVIMPRPF